MKRLLLSLVATLLALPALAQSWPGAAPMTIVMGFPAGSGVDIVARLFQVPMEQALGATAKRTPTREMNATSTQEVQRAKQ